MKDIISIALSKDTLLDLTNDQVIGNAEELVNYVNDNRLMVVNDQALFRGMQR